MEIKTNKRLAFQARAVYTVRCISFVKILGLGGLVLFQFRIVGKVLKAILKDMLFQEELSRIKELLNPSFLNVVLIWI